MNKKLIVFLFVSSLVCIAGFVSANSPDRLVGSTKSNKYHYEACRVVKKIEYKNVRIFVSLAEAIKAGYIPCKICQPAVIEKEN